ncbi:unnamed protein product [Ectocarpus fasciculatus]
MVQKLQITRLTLFSSVMTPAASRTNERRHTQQRKLPKAFTEQRRPASLCRHPPLPGQKQTDSRCSRPTVIDHEGTVPIFRSLPNLQGAPSAERKENTLPAEGKS